MTIAKASTQKSHLPGSLRKPWMPLHFLNLYRLLISGIFVSFIYTNIQLRPFGAHDPELFQLVSIGYLISSFLCGFTIRWKWPSLKFQSHFHIIIDLCALMLLIHVSGGVKSGVGILLLTPIAASSILNLGRMSFVYAAAMSILILLDQTYLYLTKDMATNYTQAGILGAILFITAYLTNYLVQRTEESEQIASQRETDLANMEQLTKFIMERLQTAVIVVDHIGNVRLLNDSAKNLVQHSKQSTKKVNIYEYSIDLGEMFNKWKEEPDGIATTFIMKGSSSEYLPRFARLGQRVDSGAVIFIEDHSELSKQAQQLKLASLGCLTASIAHELRNPLAAIRHAGELLNESPSLNDTDKRLTEIIEKQSVRVNEIIGSVLDLSRRKKAEQEKINVYQWIKQFLEEYIQLPQERFYLDFPSKDIEIQFDAQHLQQIVDNLIQNALRHSNGKEGRIHPIVIEGGINKSSHTPFLKIINYGEGIKKENIPSLFEPFFTTESTGTGLGLYIGRELAECNQAKLDYIDIEEGACFQISFTDQRRV